MSSMNNAKAELARRELARRKTFDFIQYTKPNYVSGWFNRKLCDLIDVFLERVKKKDSPRIILSIPPRFGKSEVVTRRLPTYAMALTPGLQFIGATHTQTLADINGSDVREIILSPNYKDLFNCEIDERFAAKDFLKLKNGSSCKEVGIGVGLPGFGADILSIDDVFPGRQEADSQTERDRVWNWMKGVAFNRVMPGGGVILTMTRWHVDDPIGRILASPEAKFWDVFDFPAIAEKDEPERKKGESLHPERWPVSELMIRKRETDERGWAALFQGRPFLDGGNWFKDDKIHWYDKRPDNLNWFLAADYAVTVKSTSDHTAIGAFGVSSDGDLWLHDDMYYGKYEPLESVNNTLRLGKKVGAHVLTHEKGAIAAVLEPLFRLQMPKENHYLVFEKYARTTQKHIHALAIKGMMEAGKVHLPNSLKPLVRPLLLAFSPDADGEDDIIDMLATAGLMMQKAVVRPPPPALPDLPKRETILEERSRAAREELDKYKREREEPPEIEW